MAAVIVISFILILTGICVTAGSMLLRWSVGWDLQKNPTLEVGASYFIGVAALLFFWRLMELLLHNASYALILALFMIGAISLFRRRSPLRLLQHKTALFLLFLSTSLVLTVYWTKLNPDGLEAFANIGSLHTGRYSNLALFIANNNRIPVVGQNFEQSLLASIPAFFGFSRPALALCLWLCICQGALAIFCHGALRFFGLTNARSIVGTVIVLFGQVSLSAANLIVVDSNSPVTLMGYSDAVRSVASYVIFLAVLYSMRMGCHRWGAYGVVLMFWFGWGASGPQNIFLALTMILVSILRNTWIKAATKPLLVTLVLGIVTTAAIRPLGGFLTPAQLRETLPVPGVLNEWSGPTRPGAFIIRPQIPFFAFDSYGPNGLLASPEFNLKERRGFPATIRYWIFLAENQLWLGLRVIFFALLGLVALGTSQNKDKFESALCFFSVLTFIAGAALVYPFLIDGMRWSWSRLMIPGYALAMFCLVVYWNRLSMKWPHRNRRLGWVLACLVLCFGPVADVASHWTDNLKSPAHFWHNFRVIFLLDHVIS